MLRVHLGCESRFNIKFYGADSHFCYSITSRDLTWNSGRLTRQHASHIYVVAHISWGVTKVSSALIGIYDFIVRRDAECP
jgi:hypothetical protein